ncbi:hypothetical protein CBER1_11531 [Cercospora berteroae]|uniref:Uncharacterized protein n=1 Tax=Cercospora berteroae TaxID=357750 RepID=A0A2S6C0A2_9PEZI|nr:hypothetical protein CBER1_11531 [Cercospora berteroae]
MADQNLTSGQLAQQEYDQALQDNNKALSDLQDQRQKTNDEMIAFQAIAGDDMTMLHEELALLQDGLGSLLSARRAYDALEDRIPVLANAVQVGAKDLEAQLRRVGKSFEGRSKSPEVLGAIQAAETGLKIAADAIKQCASLPTMRGKDEALDSKHQTASSGRKDSVGVDGSIEERKSKTKTWLRRAADESEDKARASSRKKTKVQNDSDEDEEQVSKHAKKAAPPKTTTKTKPASKEVKAKAPKPRKSKKSTAATNKGQSDADEEDVHERLKKLEQGKATTKPKSTSKEAKHEALKTKKTKKKHTKTKTESSSESSSEASSESSSESSAESSSESEDEEPQEKKTKQKSNPSKTTTKAKNGASAKSKHTAQRPVSESNEEVESPAVKQIKVKKEALSTSKSTSKRPVSASDEEIESPAAKKSKVKKEVLSKSAAKRSASVADEESDQPPAKKQKAKSKKPAEPIATPEPFARRRMQGAEDQDSRTKSTKTKPSSKVKQEEVLSSGNPSSDLDIVAETPPRSRGDQRNRGSRSVHGVGHGSGRTPVNTPPPSSAVKNKGTPSSKSKGGR